MTRRLSCTFRPSHASSPTPPPSSTPTFNWLLCVICKMAAALRPCHPPSSLYFLTALILTPQASEPMTVNASLMAHGLRMALGRGGAMIWWRRCSTHEERGKSCWVVAAWVGCCVLFCWSDTWRILPLPYLRYTDYYTLLCQFDLLYEDGHL